MSYANAIHQYGEMVLFGRGDYYKSNYNIALVWSRHHRAAKRTDSFLGKK